MKGSILVFQEVDQKVKLSHHNLTWYYVLNKHCKLTLGFSVCSVHLLGCSDSHRSYKSTPWKVMHYEDWENCCVHGHIEQINFKTLYFQIMLSNWYLGRVETKCGFKIQCKSRILSHSTTTYEIHMNDESIDKENWSSERLIGWTYV